jgi:spermidine synthase
VIEREVIDRRTTPHGEVQLQRRGEHYEIVSNGVFLMATCNADSARLLVTSALDAVGSPNRVLIGGLGAGVSLGVALADRRVSHVTVVEIEEPLIAWNRTHLAAFSDDGLDDLRTRVVRADLLRWLQETDDVFDVICVDIDNGPNWTVTDENRALYGHHGLAALRRRLAPGGAVTFWSASAAPSFARRLGRHFGRVETLAVEQPRGEPDYVYLARAR